MVTNRKYVSTFCDIMPKRFEVMRNAFSAKKVLDAELKNILNNKGNIKETVVKLMQSIGSDNDFNKNQSSQSLRYYIWKSKNSLYFLINQLNTVLSDGSTVVMRMALKDKGVDVDSIFKEFVLTADVALKTYHNLEELVMGQYSKLNAGDLKAYNLLVSEENRLVSKLQPTFKRFTTKFETFIESVKKLNTTSVGRDDSLAEYYDFILFVGAVVAVTVGSLAYLGILSPALGSVGIVSELALALLRNPILRVNPDAKAEQLLEAIAWPPRNFFSF